MAVNHIKKIVVKDSAIFSLLNGSPLYGKGILRLEKSIKENDLVAVLSGKGELICIAVAKTDADQMKNRNLCLRPDRVMMEKGKYPKFK
jgi:H/ACA ribonucleoprotein complex subunit 4